MGCCQSRNKEGASDDTKKTIPDCYYDEKIKSMLAMPKGGKNVTEDIISLNDQIDPDEALSPSLSPEPRKKYSRSISRPKYTNGKYIRKLIMHIVNVILVALFKH